MIGLKELEKKELETMSLEQLEIISQSLYDYMKKVDAIIQVKRRFKGE